MHDPLELPSLDAAAPVVGVDGSLPAADLERLNAVTVELAVEVGRTHMSLGETLALGPGSVVTLDRLADQAVDLLVNGKPIARGEVVVIDEQFGLRITEVNGAEAKAGAAGQADPSVPSADDLAAIAADVAAGLAA